MQAADTVAVRTRHQARPGRRAIVVTDLASLRGPVRGTVELPLRLFWSGPDRSFDLDQGSMRHWLYQAVLCEASRPDDLAGFLNRDLLISMWPDLRLPAGVRQAWEEIHPVLRARPARISDDLAASPQKLGVVKRQRDRHAAHEDQASSGQDRRPSLPDHRCTHTNFLTVPLRRRGRRCVCDAGLKRQRRAE